MTTPTYSILQSMVLPDAALCKDASVWVRLRDGATLSKDGESISLAANEVVGLDTAFNIFPLGKWQMHADLKDLSLAIEGNGLFELTVTQVQALDAHAVAIVSSSVKLSSRVVTRVYLNGRPAPGPGGVLSLTLRAVGPAVLRSITWQTRDLPRRKPQICLAITTFKREAAVAASAARFVEFLATSPNAENLYLIVVDNGQTTRLPASDKVTLITNRNLGGAGGFARGLREAHLRGATHCLFMDDDASVRCRRLSGCLHCWLSPPILPPQLQAV